MGFVNTCRQKIQSRKPDIVFLDEEENQCFIVDIAVPVDARIAEKEKEKRLKSTKMLRSKVENSNSAYVKLCLYSINIPGFQRQIDLIRVNFKQIHDEVGPDKVKYPTHDGLGFLESKYKLILSSVFKSS